MSGNILVETLPDDGTFPNSTLPVVIYTGAIQHVGRDPAVVFEKTFKSNGWTGSWRNGIYDYHHYHSTAHEVLGVARGRVKVHLGGPHGKVFDLAAGDVVVIPAGVSHKNIGSSDDLLVIGAYPRGTSADMQYGRKGERLQADENIAAVPLPDTDPISGAEEPLLRCWVS